MLIPIIAFIVLLFALILVHELGHFITAKKTGMTVEEFGFGLPPRAAGIKRGGTIYSLNWLPIGGFVKILGEDGSHRSDNTSFASKSIGKRAIVLSAGVIMNVIFAYLVFVVGFTTGYPAALDDNNDQIAAHAENRRVQIGYVVPKSPAETAGLKLGDIIQTINTQPVLSAGDVVSFITTAETSSVDVILERAGEQITIAVPVDPDTHKIGIQPVTTGIVRMPWYEALWQGAVETVQLVWLIILGLYGILKALVTSGQVAGDVAGPIGIAQMSIQITHLGIAHYLRFAGLLSLNLAVINILPIPALDGGRLLFLLIEKIKGSPVSHKLEHAFHATGFALLIALIILITIRDIIRL